MFADGAFFNDILTNRVVKIVSEDADDLQKIVKILQKKSVKVKLTKCSCLQSEFMSGATSTNYFQSQQRAF